MKRLNEDLGVFRILLFKKTLNPCTAVEGKEELYETRFQNDKAWVGSATTRGTLNGS